MEDSSTAGFRKRKKLHPIWDFFTDKPEGSFCKICDEQIAKNHSAMKSHYRRAHNDSLGTLIIPYKQMLAAIEDWETKKANLGDMQPQDTATYSLEALTSVPAIVCEYPQSDEPVYQLSPDVIRYLQSLCNSSEVDRALQVLKERLQKSGVIVHEAEAAPGPSDAARGNGHASAPNPAGDQGNSGKAAKNKPITVKQEVSAVHSLQSEPAEDELPQSASPCLMLPENLLSVFQEAASDSKSDVFSLSKSTTMTDMIGLAEELNIQFFFNASRSEFCFSNDDNLILVLIDNARSVELKIKVDDRVIDEAVWKKADWDQFLWAVRGKISKTFGSGKKA